MKILDVSEFYSEDGGGVRTYVEQKFAAAKALGHQLTLVAPGPEDVVKQTDGGKIIWVKSPIIPVDHRYHLFWSQKPIDDIVERERPDLIEGSSPWRGGWFAGRQSRDIAKALVIHQDPVLSYPHMLFATRLSAQAIDRAFQWFYRYFARMQNYFDVTVVSSDWLADRLESFGMRRPTPVQFGVDRPRFLKAAPSPELRRRMLARCGVADETATLFFSVCRLHPEKRVPVMLRAFEKASQRAPMALYHVGDGPRRKAMHALAETIPGVCLSGPNRDRDEMAAMFATADGYLHACPNETFGMTLAEAMTAGAPLIVPDAGGARDLARPDFAEIFPPDDVDAMADAILRFCARDDIWRQKARASARALAPSNADHFRRLFALYEKLVDQHALSRAVDRRTAPDLGALLEKVA